MDPQPSGIVLASQRELLRRLGDLTSQQTAALDAGDLAVLTSLSELRTRAVREAAPFLPPRCAWEPGVADQLALVRRDSESLRQAIGACMARIRRELVTLTRQEQVTGYLARELPRQGATWTS